ncbi:MAG: hypothetical protein QOJ09_262 [Actinomycetota bacterium]|jgi:hypothetical protein|nr:hypothetical protein [Actinomycetota bacterium]
MTAPVLTPVEPEDLLDDEGEGADGTRSLVRLLAAAATVLLISFLVVNRSGDAFRSGTDATSRFRSGSVSLSDDDTDRSLFDVPAMVPGQHYENCITVTYAGVQSQAAVALAARATGALASGMHMTLDVGRGGGFGSCAGYAPERALYDGGVETFAKDHGPGNGLAAFTPAGPGDSRTFRFGFELSPNASPGERAGVDFDWSVG